MDDLTDAGTEAARQALAAERLRSARVLGLLRFVGISIAGALNLLLPEVLHETRPCRPTSACWPVTGWPSVDERRSAADGHKNEGA